MPSVVEAGLRGARRLEVDLEGGSDGFFRHCGRRVVGGRGVWVLECRECLLGGAIGIPGGCWEGHL